MWMPLGGGRQQEGRRLGLWDNTVEQSQGTTWGALPAQTFLQKRETSSIWFTPLFFVSVKTAKPMWSLIKTKPRLYM